jgi:hypothetical protein
MELSMSFGGKFEDADSLHGGVAFLYRITYTDDKVTIVVRHGGSGGENTERHYSRENDTPDNSVELYSATFMDDPVEAKRLSFHYDIREPESCVRTLRAVDQPAVRAWRGRLRQGPMQN